MQFYGISFMHPYKQSGLWKDVEYQAHPSTDQKERKKERKKEMP
jgi:hypothetical protein